jgi:hypothetical protein
MDMEPTCSSRPRPARAPRQPLLHPCPTSARRQPPAPASIPFLLAKAHRRPALIASLSPTFPPPAYDGGSPQLDQSSRAACPYRPLRSPQEGATTALPSACLSLALCCIVQKKGEKLILQDYVFKCFRCFIVML